MILSRACRESKIMLWKIKGFDSRRPVPRFSATSDPDASNTRSAWKRDFQLIHQFSFDQDKNWPDWEWCHFALAPDVGLPTATPKDDWLLKQRATDVSGDDSDVEASDWDRNEIISKAARSRKTSPRFGQKRKRMEVTVAEANDEIGPLLAMGDTSGSIQLWNMKRLKLKVLPSVTAVPISRWHCHSHQDVPDNSVDDRNSTFARLRSKSEWMKEGNYAALECIPSNTKVNHGAAKLSKNNVFVAHLAWSENARFLVAARPEGTICIYKRSE
jgi:hypothetical protein